MNDVEKVPVEEARTEGEGWAGLDTVGTCADVGGGGGKEDDEARARRCFGGGGTFAMLNLKGIRTTEGG